MADRLIPPTDDVESPSALPEFAACLERALAARPRRRAAIVADAMAIAAESGARRDAALRALAQDRPDDFQALSTVVAGAYLMVPAVRKAIGYRGQQRDHPRFDEAAEEIMDGILDPVVERGPIFRAAP